MSRTRNSNNFQIEERILPSLPAKLVIIKSISLCKLMIMIVALANFPSWNDDARLSAKKSGEIRKFDFFYWPYLLGKLNFLKELVIFWSTCVYKSHLIKNYLLVFGSYLLPTIEMKSLVLLNIFGRVDRKVSSNLEYYDGFQVKEHCSC